MLDASKLEIVRELGFRFGLESACVAREPKEDIPIPLHNEFIQIGNLNIHFSHKPYVYKGVNYCINCACYATNRLKSLHPSAQCVLWRGNDS